MSKFLSGPALVAKCRAGRGAIVVLEGETADEDPFYYGRWFDDLALQVSFEPQNGWRKVVSAVEELRAAIPERRVYGIIDRDFADEATISAQEQAVPGDGVFRTRWYTLENYLLEPEGWMRCARALCRGNVPEQWGTEDAVRARIAEAYQKCIPVAAYNLVVHQEHAREPSHAMECLKYVDHVDGVKSAPEARLLKWGEQRGAPAPLDEAFAAQVTRLEREPPEVLPCFVTGKAVLKAFLGDFPTWKGKRAALEILVSLYLREYPAPPAELAGLVRRIVAEGRG